MEAFEDDGVFWLPGKESASVAGHLKFDPIEGATLSLTGTLDDMKDHFARSQAPRIRIHGVAGRRYLTLDKCFASNTSLDMPGIARQTYTVGLVIAGHLFDNDESLTFDKCAVEFDQLPTWVRRSGVQVMAAAPTDTQRADHIVIDFHQLPDETVMFGGEQLTLHSTWILSGDNIRETSLYQTTQLELGYPTAKSLDEILSDVKWLQDLILPPQFPDRKVVG
jgi:hypothetical protein